MCRVWRFYQIVCGFLYKLPECPKVPEYSVISTFSENIASVGRDSPCNTEEAEQIFYCTDEQRLKSMSSLVLRSSRDIYILKLRSIVINQQLNSLKIEI